MEPVELILSKLPDVRKNNRGWTAKCPAHDDQQASLSISRGDDGRVLLYCHAGCLLDAILREIGLTKSDLFPRPEGTLGRGAPKGSRDGSGWPTAEAAQAALEGRHGKSSRHWSYRDAAGQIVGMVIRWDRDGRKEVRPLAKVGAQWQNRAMPVPRPLYSLPALGGASDAFVVEGEPPADALRALGLCATTSAGGANAARQTDWAPLRGRTVTILPDADKAGRRYADDVSCLLSQLDPPAEVRILQLPGLRPDNGDDAVEYIAARRKAGLNDAAIRTEIEKLASAAPVWTPTCSSTPSPMAEIPWENPEPFGQFDLPAFPLDALRSQFCPKCPLWPVSAAVAEAYQVPVDLPAMLALAVAGAALGKRCEVQVWPDWWEPVNLFVVVVMEPGERKSAVFREITAPLGEFERDECERLAPGIERNRSDLRMLNAAVRHAEQEAAKTKDPAKREKAKKRAHELVQELRRTAALLAPRLVADDATPEALAKLLHEQGGRIALLSPEGGVFEQMAGRYSDGLPNLDVYLKGHAGDDVRIDRVSRPPEFVGRPALTVGLAVQPEVLRGLADKPGFRGRGLLARFLYALPTSKVGYRALHPRAIPEAVREAYARAIRSALELEPTIDASGAAAPHVIRPDREALAVLDEFRAEVEQAMREGGDLIAVRDWALKIPGAVARIAAVLHGLEHVGRDRPGDVLLSRQAMAAAVTIGKYLMAHAKAAFFEMGADPSIGLAQRLVDWIRERRSPTFTRREAYRRLRGSVRSVDAVDAPLELLLQHGCIRLTPSGRAGPGRKPSSSFEVHPALFGHNGQNGHNSAAERDSVHSVHSVPESGTENCHSAVTSDPWGSGSQPAGDPNSVPVELDEELAEDISVAAGLLGEAVPGFRPADQATNS